MSRSPLTTFDILPENFLVTRLTKRIHQDFAQAGTVLQLLDDLADRHPGDAMFRTERLQAALIVLANGDLAELHKAIELAETDWRDLLVAAELAEASWPQRLDQALGPQ